MTTLDPSLQSGRILDTDAKLRDFLANLLGTPIRRQVWAIFLDDESRITGPFIPMADFPASPEPLTDVGSFGLKKSADLFTTRIAEMCEIVGGHSIVFVWEYPDIFGMSVELRTWASAMAQAAHRYGLPLRAQFGLHEGGFLQLTPADLMRRDSDVA